jgi:hypothetical protein
LSDKPPVQNGLKGDDLTTSLFNFALQYAIRNVQENQVGLKLNGAHQLLLEADEVDSLEDYINKTKKGTEVLIDTSIGISPYLGRSSNTDKHNIYCSVCFPLIGNIVN